MSRAAESAISSFVASRKDCFLSSTSTLVCSSNNSWFACHFFRPTKTKIDPQIHPMVENHGMNLTMKATVSCLPRIAACATLVTDFKSASDLYKSNDSFRKSQGTRTEMEIMTTPRETMNLYRSPNSNFTHFSL
ncbi:hypothetical protein D3C75_1059670 [compost metagenome]